MMATSFSPGECASIVDGTYCGLHRRRDSVPYTETMSGDSMQGGISRRTFVLRGGAALASLGLLAACTPAAPSAPAGSAAAPATGKPAAAGKLQLPTYVPFKGISPDVPGTDVIPDGYQTY